MAGMIKTSTEICTKCKYGTLVSTAQGVPVCNYFTDTGNRRGCPIGYCDKFVEGKRRNQLKVE